MKRIFSLMFMVCFSYSQLLVSMEIIPEEPTILDPIEIAVTALIFDDCLAIIEDEVQVIDLPPVVNIAVNTDFIDYFCLGMPYYQTYSVWVDPLDLGSYTVIINTEIYGEPIPDYEPLIGFLSVSNVIYGCTDAEAFNYDPDANTDDGSCIYEMLGDLDDNEELNVLDVIQLVNLILNQEFNFIADINFDEIVDVLDLVLLVDIILNPED